MNKEKLVVIRVSSYQQFNFIEEHQKVLNKKGTVWMLKLGKLIPRTSLDEIINGKRTIILRAPKKAGGDLYLCNVLEVSYAEPSDSSLCPKYYEEMKNSCIWDSFEGTWFLLDSIKRIDEKYYPHFKLLKNDKYLMDVLNETRTSVLYVYCDTELVL